MRRLTLPALLGVMSLSCSLSSEGIGSSAAAAGSGAAPASSVESSAATGTGGAGGSSGASTTGPGAASSSGTGGTPETNCLNGLDDDGDGATDCDDTDCADYACVPAYPGAVAYLVVGATSCAPPLAEHDLVDCGGCTCNAAGGTCELTMGIYQGAGCTNQVGPDVVSPWPTNGCFDNPDGNRYFKGTAMPRNDASCAAATPTVPPTHTDACAVTSVGTCNGGAACVPAPGGMAAKCVLLAGDAKCSAPYANVGVYYDDDGAAACDCTCTPSAQTCLPAFAHVATNSDSCGGATMVAIDGGCHQVQGTESYALPDGAGDVKCAGSSAPSSDPSAPVLTLCCTP